MIVILPESALGQRFAARGRSLVVGDPTGEPRSVEPDTSDTASVRRIARSRCSDDTDGEADPARRREPRLGPGPGPQHAQPTAIDAELAAADFRRFVRGLDVRAAFTPAHEGDSPCRP